jgi:hypothetical protein
MNPSIQFRKLIAVSFIMLLLGCFALLHRARAVGPAPDGGYPGGNTAEGQNALLSFTSGGYNMAIGWLSLRSETTGNFNTAIGAGTLLANTVDENTAIGAGALLSNTTGHDNTANGAFALFSNTTGLGNTANGTSALFNNTTGTGNTATGADALFSNTGSGNTANGASALVSNATGNFNTANGFGALTSNTAGDGNTAIGRDALSNTTGSANTALGANAGSALTTGNNNIDIGIDVIGGAGEANTIRIGNPNITTAFIRGISGATASGGAAVNVASNGQLGTMTSSARFKDEIRPMDKASEALVSLKPVAFRYKKAIDPGGIQQFGLVAEDVEKVNPDLVVRDKQGQVNTVRYEAVNAMLLNEFLKEHRKVEQQDHKIQEQDGTIAQLKQNFAEQQKQIEALTAGLQKVSAQLQLRKPEPQTALNDHQSREVR